MSKVLCYHHSGYYRLHVHEWGNKDAIEKLMCIHGLTRNGLDFEFLAQALLPDFHIISPDMVGRGESDWLRDDNGYTISHYMTDVATILSQYFPDGNDGRGLSFVGTSMGGIIGMIMASLPNSPIKKLVINDVGALIPSKSLKRIAAYIRSIPTFTNEIEFRNYLATIYAPFHPMSKRHWEHIVKSSRRVNEHGKFYFNYDPSIAENFIKEGVEDILLWDFWDNINCPVLLIQGETSDLLTTDIIDTMRKRGPNFDFYQHPKVGHAPMLMSDKEITIIKQWLKSH